LPKSTQRRRATRSTRKSTITRSTSITRKRMTKLKKRRRLKRKLKRKRRLSKRLMLDFPKKRRPKSQKRTNILFSKVVMIWTVMISSEPKSLRIRKL